VTINGVFCNASSHKAAAMLQLLTFGWQAGACFSMPLLEEARSSLSSVYLTFAGKIGSLHDTGVQY